MFSSILTLNIHVSKNQGYLSSKSVFKRERVSPTDLSCFTDSLLLLIDNRQFVGFLHKLSSIYRNKLIVIQCALIVYNSGETQTCDQAYYYYFFAFGHDTLWQNPRKRRGGKLSSSENAAVSKCIQLVLLPCYRKAVILQHM